MNAPDPVGTLLSRVRQLAAKRPRTLTIAQMAQDTGLSEHWLRKVLSGATPDPSVNKIEQLYTYLTGKALEL